MVWNTWKEQNFVVIGHPSPRLVCVSCQQVIDEPGEHDWNLCELQYRELLKWRSFKGEVLYAD